MLALLLGCQQQNTKTDPGFDPAQVYMATDGRQYRLQQLDKKPGGYTWISDTLLRYYPDGFYEVERQDDAHFFVRQYLVVDVAPIRTPDDRDQQAIEPTHSTAWRWQDFGTGLPRSGQWRDHFAVADMNRDGHADLVFTPARKTLGAPVVFLHDGRGAWRQWSQATFPRLGYDYGGAAVADFNRDGHADIALGMHLLGIVALSGDEIGRYTDLSVGLPERRRGKQPILSSREVATMDWNGDETPDLLVMNERIGADPTLGIRGGLVVFLQQDGRWVLAPTDVERDQAQLLALDPERQRIAVSPGLPTATALPISVRSSGQWQTHVIAGFPDNARFTALAMHAQEEGDEIAVAYQARAAGAWWTHVDLVREQQGIWRRRALLATANAASPRALRFAHVAPSVAPLLVTLDERGRIDLYAPSADGRYTRDQAFTVPHWRAGCGGYGLEAADLDGDGRDEIIASFAGEPNPFAGTTDCPAGGGVQALKLEVND